VVFISCSVLLLLFIKRLLDVIQLEAFIFIDYLHIGEQPNTSPCFSTVFFYNCASLCYRNSQSIRTNCFRAICTGPGLSLFRTSVLYQIPFVIWIFVLSAGIAAALIFILFAEVKRLYRNPSYWNGVTLLPRLRLLLHFFLHLPFIRGLEL